MDKDAVIAVLRAHEAELKALGIVHAGLFGSVARDEQGPKSDIDIAIDLDPARHPTIYDYVGMQHRISALFEGAVDVVDRDALKPRIRDRVAGDLIDAF